MKKFTGLAVGVLVLTMGAGLVVAQEGERRGGAEQRRGQAGPGAERPRIDRAEMEARMQERMRERLGFSTEEWSAISPLMQKVTTAQRNARGGAMGAWGGPGGPGGPGAQGGQPTPVARATADLRETLDKDDASAEEISQKLAALREARRSAEAQLAAARKELQEVLSQKQEAMLVMAGILE